MVYLLFYNNPNEYWQTRWSWIIKWCGNYGVHPVIIDPKKIHNRSDTPPFYFRSLEEALAHPAFLGCSWVWMDANGSTYLDEFVHPQDNVIYCIGDDMTGFQNVQHDGARIKVRPFDRDVDSNGIYWAAMIAPLVLNDRNMYLMGKRI